MAVPIGSATVDTSILMPLTRMQFMVTVIRYNRQQLPLGGLFKLNKKDALYGLLFYFIFMM